MAIVDSQLISSLSIRPVFIDPNTQQPVDAGTVTFYKTDKVTPKNVYIQTGNPIIPFESIGNVVQLGADGGYTYNSVPVILYFYPYSEDDNTTEELYYVEIEDSDTAAVYTFDKFPENFNATNPSDTSDTVDNLCPTYGFDFTVFEGEFSDENNIFLANNEDYPVQSWLWYKSDPENIGFSYSFESVPVGDIDGNPIYEITLSAENLAGVQTTNWFGFPIAYSNELSGTQINYNFYCRDKSTVAVTSIDVGIAIDGDFTIIVEDTVSIGTGRSLYTVSFTMPDLSSSLTDDVTKIWLVFGLPLSSEFSIAFTGTFCYTGDAISSSLINLDQPAVGERISRGMFQSTDPSILGNEQYYQISGLPLSSKAGELGALNDTGILRVSSTTASFDDAVPLDGRTIVRSQTLLYTLADRILDSQNASAFIANAGNTFAVSNISGSTFDVETNVTAASNSTWVSSTTDVTITQTSTTVDYGLTATIDGANDRLIHFVFDSNFNALVNATYNSNNDPNQQFFWDVISSVIQAPTSAPIVNYFGSYTQPNTTTDLVVFTPNSNLTLTTIRNGSASQAAEVDIEINANGIGSGAYSVTDEFEINSAYRSISRNTLTWLASTSTTTNGYINYPSPYTLQVHIDGTGSNVPSTVKTVHVNLTTAESQSGSSVAAAIVAALTGGDSYSITVNSVPSNGDYLEVSTSNFDIIMIFYDTTQTKPDNPDSDRAPIFISYNSTTATTDDIANLLVDAFTADIGGIPLISDLTDENATAFPTLPEYFSYFLTV